MVLDFLLNPILNAAEAVTGRMPQGQPLTLPSLDGLWSQLRGFDSLVPVMGPLSLMLGLLALGVVFVAARLVLTVWNLIWP